MPPLVQIVLLSRLLHVLVVIVFGDPEGGGGSRLGGWHALPFAVTLRPLSQERGSPFKADVAFARTGGPVRVGTR